MGRRWRREDDDHPHPRDAAEAMVRGASGGVRAPSRSHIGEDSPRRSRSSWVLLIMGGADVTQPGMWRSYIRNGAGSLMNKSRIGHRGFTIVIACMGLLFTSVPAAIGLVMNPSRVCRSLTGITRQGVARPTSPFGPFRHFG